MELEMKPLKFIKFIGKPIFREGGRAQALVEGLKKEPQICHIFYKNGEWQDVYGRKLNINSSG